MYNIYNIFCIKSKNSVLGFKTLFIYILRNETVKSYMIYIN